MQHFETFISYRRDGGREIAQLLKTTLDKQNGISAFFDIDNLHFGDFRRQLVLSNVSSHYLILLLSPGALDRCKNKGDWVATEIRLFLKLRKTIIPVIFDGFTFPDDLPEDLKKLKDFEPVPCAGKHDSSVAAKVIARVRKGWSQDEIRQAAIERDRVHAYNGGDAIYSNKDDAYLDAYYKEAVPYVREPLVSSVAAVTALFMLLQMALLGAFEYDTWMKNVSAALVMMAVFNWYLRFCRDAGVVETLYAKGFFGAFWKALGAFVKLGLIVGAIVVASGFAIAFIGDYVEIPDKVLFVLAYAARIGVVALSLLGGVAPVVASVHRLILAALHVANAKGSPFFAGAYRRRGKLDRYSELAPKIGYIAMGVTAVAAIVLGLVL